MKSYKIMQNPIIIISIALAVLLVFLLVFCFHLFAEKENIKTENEYLNIVNSELQYKMNKCTEQLGELEDYREKTKEVYELLELGKNVSKRNYTLGYYDCRKFARDFMEEAKEEGFNVIQYQGLLDGDLHVYNKVCFYYEPQDNEFISRHDNNYVHLRPQYQITDLDN